MKGHKRLWPLIETTANNVSSKTLLIVGYWAGLYNIQIQEVLGRTFRLIDGVKTGGTDQQTVGQGNLRSKIICFQDFPQQERKKQ